MHKIRSLILWFLMYSQAVYANALRAVDSSEKTGRSPNQESVDISVDLAHDKFQGQLLGLKTYWYRGNEPIEVVAADSFRSNFVKGTKAVINHGYSDAHYWYRMTFFNPYSEPRKVYLHDPNNVYPVLQVYRHKQLIGNLTHHDELGKRIVEIELSPEASTTFYIKKQTIGVAHQSSWTFWDSPGLLRDHIYGSATLFHILLTVFAMSCFFTGALYFAYRKIQYIYYVAYLVSFALFATWVWSVYYIPYFTEFGALVSNLCVACTAYFVIEFLDLKRQAPFVMRLFKICSMLAIAAIFLQFHHPMARTNLTSLLAITVQIATFICGILQFIKYRQIYVLLFNFAYGFFLISGFIQMIIWLGLVDSTANQILFYGVGVENILMLVAMGYKISVTEASRKQNVDLLSHSYEQLSKVFYPHQILQIRKGRKIEETMPVTEREACVIYFSIIDGSILMHEGYEEIIEDFMVRCRGLMMEGYDPQNLRSTAHMIREMGDGFLCAVGFPFQQLGELKSLSAVVLAERIVAEFELMLTKLDAPHRIYCSVGVARGMVKSYFSKSGRIRDDLWGRAITLASGYGDFSVMLFGELRRPPHNVIILQDAVYDSLPKSKREQYEVMEMGELGIKIKEDPHGELMAFKITG